MRFSRTSPPVRLAVLLALLMLISLAPTTQATQGRAGPDVMPTAATIYYTTTANHTSHAALSSQDPSSTGMNRPSNLWIIDGMIGVEQRIEATIENVGDTAAQGFAVDIEVIHDEYDDFIIHAFTGNVPSLAPGTTTTVSTTWHPDYSGNHTIRVTTHLSGDANSGNDEGTRSLTIGNFYDQAEVGTGWSLGSNWFVNDEASLSGTSSFHVGGATSTSNYGNNWDTSLESATFDTSDAHPSPNNGFGIGFFYTGEALASDGFYVDVWGGSGWQRISNMITESVDTDFSTGSNWLITVNGVDGRAVPWWSIPPTAMNSQFKFRINFVSNSGGTSIGYWFEDIVLFYDQKARAEEFSLSTNAGTSGHARAGEWAETTLSLTNDGNLADSVELSVPNLPAGWNHRFQHMSGSQIQNGQRIDLDKGETRNVKFLVQPASGSPLGSTDIDVRVQSTEATVYSTATTNFIVDPDYQPDWLEQDPGLFCAPGNACDFQITLINAGDGQDSFALSSAQVLGQNGWTFGLKWDQPTTVTVPQGGTEIIEITANLPADAQPGMRANSAFTAVSQADPSKSATMRANVSASMISIGHVGIDAADVPSGGWWISPGESITVPFTIWNNATQQDTYTFSFDTSGVFGWTVGLPSSSNVVIAPGGTARVLVSFTAPESAVANDPGPIITPHAISTASGMSATESSFVGIRVRQLHDITLTMDTPEVDIVPGIATGMPFEVENLGNGADNVIFDLDVDDDWNWWVEINSATISGPLSLSTVIDGNSVALGTLWVEPPGSAEPGQVFELKFTARPMEGIDSTPEDAEMPWEVRTKMIAIPQITAFESDETSVWLEQSTAWIVILSNEGNTYDSSMRARVTVDSNRPGLFIQMHSDRGAGQLNGWVDFPMAAGGSEELFISFETYDSFPLGESVTLTIEVEGGRVTPQDSLVTTSTSMRIDVDQKRDLSVSWNLDADQRMPRSQPHAFQINVTTDSTMPITVTLGSTVPEGTTLDCRPHSQEGEVVLLLPASSPAPPETGTIECDVTLEPSDLARTFTFTLVDDTGEEIWVSGPVHLKTETAPPESGLSLTGSLSTNAIAAGAAVGFLLFFVAMTTLILRRRRTLDEIDEEEDDEPEIQTPGAAPVGTPVIQGPPAVAAVPVARAVPVAPIVPVQAAAPVAAVAQAAPPGPMPGAPGPMPAVAAEATPAEYSDEQLVASGWSAEQIAELRGQPAPVLTNAFDSLGVAEATPVVEAAAEPVAEPTVEPVVDTSQEAVSADPGLPVFNCMVSGIALTSEIAWWQCPSCSGFAATEAIGDHTHCPQCNAAL